jgi:eukaryotic-like serine/threonine-protein kinase
MIAGQEPMLNTGIKDGPYEIVGMLRAGGMGEVYRAHDTKLNHDAAFKGLPMPFVADAGWVAAHCGM